MPLSDQKPLHGSPIACTGKQKELHLGSHGYLALLNAVATAEMCFVGCKTTLSLLLLGERCELCRCGQSAVQACVHKEHKVTSAGFVKCTKCEHAKEKMVRKQIACALTRALI